MQGKKKPKQSGEMLQLPGLHGLNFVKEIYLCDSATEQEELSKNNITMRQHEASWLAKRKKFFYRLQLIERAGV